MGDRPISAGLQRQAGLGAVERLNLWLFSSIDSTTAWPGSRSADNKTIRAR